VEENNKFETNTDSSGNGSMLYGAEPEPQTEGSGHSAVYGDEFQPQNTEPSEPELRNTEPVQLAKQSEPSEPQNTEPVQLTKTSEPSEPQNTEPVQLTKTSEQQSATEPVQLTKPSHNTEPVQSTAPLEPSQPQNAEASQQPVPPQQGQFYQPGNGQPYQNPMGYGPMQVPPPIQGAPSAKPKKNMAGLVVGILCAAAVVLVIVIGVLVSRSLLGGGGPQRQLAKGIANMAQEMAAYQSSIAEDIGLDAINQLKDKEPVNTRIAFKITDPSATGSLDSVDIKVDGVTDYGKKMAEYDLGVGAYGFSLDIASVIAADNTVYLSVPMVFQESIYSLELTDLGKNFNNSAWSSLMEQTMPEDYSLTLFGDKDTDNGENEFQDILDRQSSITADSMKFEAISQKKAFTIDGAMVEYGGVRVTIDRDAYNESMEAMRDDILVSDFYQDFMEGYQTTYAEDFDELKNSMDDMIGQIFGIRVEQDIVLDFYLDQEGRIVNISTPEDLMVSGQDIGVDSIAVDIDFLGTERTLDSIEGGFYMQSGDEILYIGMSRTADITDDYYSEDLMLVMQDDNSDDDITFRYSNKWGYEDQTFDLEMSFEVPESSMEIRADGGYTDIVKGESYTFQLNHGALTIDGEDLLLLTGSIGIKPAENEIEVPDNAINVLEMSESDIEDLLYGLAY